AKSLNPHCLALTTLLPWNLFTEVKQSPQTLKVQEGGNATMNCTYSKSSQSLQWFRQDPGKGLISLFYLTSEMKEKGRFRSTIILKERHSSLHIDASQPSDSATYLCAVSEYNGSGRILGKGSSPYFTLPQRESRKED
uniref:Ig-like domain-containing protein n=1 Tax=Monodelphis domestica TaxID=13616 RepID=F6Z7Z8_MONDO